jgi:hypothetical protein
MHVADPFDRSSSFFDPSHRMGYNLGREQVLHNELLVFFQQLNFGAGA